MEMGQLEAENWSNAKDFLGSTAALGSCKRRSSAFHQKAAINGPLISALLIAANGHEPTFAERSKATADSQQRTLHTGVRSRLEAVRQCKA